jgi:pyruvate ferredoxin oxidoreductase gamma subunit
LTYKVEIRWHGRGGHGLVSTSNLLCEMVVRKGYYAQSIPIFGAERRGAPTQVFTRISDSPIRKRSEIKNPDIVIVTDPSLFNIIDPLHGLVDKGIVIVNANESTEISSENNFKIIKVNAVEISLESGLTVGGIPVVTIPLMGALLKILGIVDLKTVEEVIRERWRPEIAERNIKALKMASEVVEIG